MNRIGIGMAFAVVMVAISSAAAAVSDSPTLVVNKRVGDIRTLESEEHVTYDYGGDCFSGCPGVKDGCIFGLANCVGARYRYKVEGGYLIVGYRSRDQRGRRIPGRVVFLETNSPYYRTADDLGVGTHIPYGKRWGVFRLLTCGPGDTAWTAGTSWRKPLWKYGRFRWWTRLYVKRGVVWEIAIFRGDVSLQGC